MQEKYKLGFKDFPKQIHVNACDIRSQWQFVSKSLENKIKNLSGPGIASTRLLSIQILSLIATFTNDNDLGSVRIQVNNIYLE